MYALESQFDQHMPIKTKTLIAGRDIVSDSMSVFYTLFYFPLTIFNNFIRLDRVIVFHGKRELKQRVAA